MRQRLQRYPRLTTLLLAALIGWPLLAPAQVGNPLLASHTTPPWYRARVASTGNVTLSAPGASIDGVTMLGGEVVLLWQQTASAENGWWIWNGAASAMTRAPFAAAAPQFLFGTTTVISEGQTHAGRLFVFRNTAEPTLGTTALIFSTNSEPRHTELEITDPPSGNCVTNGYSLGSRWRNTLDRRTYLCQGTDGEPEWTQITQTTDTGASATLQQLFDAANGVIQTSAERPLTITGLLPGGGALQFYVEASGEPVFRCDPDCDWSFKLTTDGRFAILDSGGVEIASCTEAGVCTGFGAGGTVQQIIRSGGAATSFACTNPGPSNNFFSFWGSQSTGESIHLAHFGRAMTLKTLDVKLGNNVPASQSVVVTLKVNNSDSIKACTIAAGASTCTDTDDLSVNASDTGHFKAACSGGTSTWGNISIVLTWEPI